MQHVDSIQKGSFWSVRKWLHDLQSQVYYQRLTPSPLRGIIDIGAIKENLRPPGYDMACKR